MIIVLLGLDGSGKSTLISLFEKEIGGDNVVIRHLRPYFAKSQKKRMTGIICQPHGELPRKFLLSIIKLLYFWMDYTFGLWILKLTNKKKMFFLFDRYYYDILVDPERYRLPVFTKITRLIAKMIPLPDKVVLLDVPAELAHQRKPEIPIKTAKELEFKYKELMSIFGKRSVILDGRKPAPLVLVDLMRSLGISEK